MQRLLASLAFAGTFASGIEVPCAVVGKFYDDSSVTFPSLYLADEAACQASCKASPVCKVFTFYKDKGSCWLQTDKAHLLTPANSTLAQETISGPKVCPDAAAAPGVSDGEQQPNQTEKVLAAEGGGAPESSAVPWWGWGIGGGVVAVGAAGVGMWIWGSSGESSPKKAKKSSKRAAKVETEEPASSAPLMQAGLLPQVAAVPSISQPVMNAGAVAYATPMYAPTMSQPQYVVVEQPQSFVMSQQGYEHEMPMAAAPGYPNFSSFGALPAGAMPVQYLPVQQEPAASIPMPQGYEQA